MWMQPRNCRKSQTLSHLFFFCARMVGCSKQNSKRVLLVSLHSILIIPTRPTITSDAFRWFCSRGALDNEFLGPQRRRRRRFNHFYGGICGSCLSPRLTLLSLVLVAIFAVYWPIFYLFSSASFGCCDCCIFSNLFLVISTWPLFP